MYDIVSGLQRCADKEIAKSLFMYNIKPYSCPAQLLITSQYVW